MSPSRKSRAPATPARNEAAPSAIDHDATKRELIRLTRALGRRVGELRFAPPVTHVYNPLDYARTGFEAYLRQHARKGVDALLVGMNPGPFGMVQTGVPFGEIGLVRDWLGIEARVGRPDPEHPKRAVLGFECPRSEVSGARLWGWARDAFGTPDAFFRRFFVWNYCPLAFLEESGRNRTPDKLRPEERERLFAICDQALRDAIAVIAPRRVIGIGVFAEERARKSLAESGLPIGSMLHPSPASPAANRDWSGTIATQLRELGVEI